MDREGIIIGGGAAGLMAAIAAAENGARVVILEHMPRVGKKILSTGNGRCNLTNQKLDGSCYRCSQEEFPMQVIGHFPVEETLRFFRRLGVVTTDRNGYVYPASNQAQTVLDALREKAESLGVRIFCDCKVLSLKKTGERFTVTAEIGMEQQMERKAADGKAAGRKSAERKEARQKAERRIYHGGFLILAAGSMAAKSTGSDGSGYEFAKSFGHKIIKPLPALVQLRCRGNFFKSVSGVRTEAAVTLVSEGEILASDRGELQLTDYGISGIPVFQVSRFASLALDRKKQVSAVLDFYPQTDFDGMLSLLQEQKQWLFDRKAGSFLNGIFNKKLASLFLKEAGIHPEVSVSDFKKGHLLKLCGIMKEFSIPVTATNSYDQAQVCMGGVRTAQIDGDTMESRLVKDLYLAGEILDVDGICGGYNLQWAWSSGYLAGKSAAVKGN